MYEKNREASALAEISRAISEQQRLGLVRACEYKSDKGKAI
jgi:hypothetical protein